MDRLPIIHPGEILREEFLEPLGLSASQLAGDLGVTRQTVSEIVRERRGISADMAIRLGRYFRTTPQFWMNLQSSFELREAQESMGGSIERIVECERIPA